MLVTECDGVCQHRFAAALRARGDDPLRQNFACFEADDSSSDLGGTDIESDGKRATSQVGILLSTGSI